MMAYWHRMSSRERLLFGVTAALVIGLALYIVIAPARAHLQELDDRIGDLEFRLQEYTRVIERSPQVNAAYAKIAEEHGTDLTKEEIHDGLRNELVRLALRDMPPPGQAPQDTGNPGARLINWVQLPEGDLNTGLQGYREYSIEFKTAHTSISNVVDFLRRIQESPYALRVRKLEIIRAPQAESSVMAVIDLARIVVDGVPEEIASMVAETHGVNLLENPSFEQVSTDGQRFPAWTVQNGQTTEERTQFTDESRSMRLTANAGGATVFQEIQLEGGATYSMSLDMAADGPARIGVATPSGQSYQGAVDIAGPGDFARHTLRFTVEGEPGAVIPLRAPVIETPQPGASIVLDNVVLKKLRG